MFSLLNLALRGRARLVPPVLGRGLAGRVSFVFPPSLPIQRLNDPPDVDIALSPTILSSESPIQSILFLPSLGVEL